MPRQLDLGEIPLADGLEQAVIADVRVLLGGGEGVAASCQAVATCRLGRGGRGVDKAVHRRVLRENHTWKLAFSLCPTWNIADT